VPTAMGDHQRVVCVVGPWTQLGTFASCACACAVGCPEGWESHASDAPSLSAGARWVFPSSPCRISLPVFLFLHYTDSD
jgi:hypothetical protein